VIYAPLDFTVTTPTFAASANTGSEGTVVSVHSLSTCVKPASATANGWNVIVQVAQGANSQLTYVNLAVAVDGSWSGQITIPGTAIPGPAQLTATCFDSGTSVTPRVSYAPLDFTVTAHTTSSIVACSPNPAVVGQSSQCTATVSNTDVSNAAAPLGTVLFAASGSGTFDTIACSLVAGAGATASCSVTYTPSALGPQNISAAYSGDTNHQGSTGSTSLVVSDQPITITPQLITSTELAPFSATVATFRDPDPSETGADFRASIDWGDGRAASGSIAPDGSGGFIVSGSHTYAEEGSYAVTVSIVDMDASTVTVSSVATVADPAASPTGGFIVAGVEGMSTGVVAVATFTDPGGAEVLGDYSASVNWGDGSTSIATIIFDSGTSKFTVVASHTYADEGTSTFVVTIHHDSAADAVVLGDATIADADRLSGSPVAISPSESQVFNGNIATFIDANSSATHADFTASINWGDGTITTGSVSDGNPGLVVSGNHLYDEGTFTIKIILTDDNGGASASVTNNVTVAESDLLAGKVANVAAVEDQMFSGLVATFSDQNTANGPFDFVATIDWGDGSTSRGTLSGGNGRFAVNGDHTYREGGYYRILAILSDVTPGTATATASQWIRVADYPLTATGTTLTARRGRSFTATIANFKDVDQVSSASDYFVLIGWGDGSFSTGTVTGSNPFSIAGTHIYRSAGTYTAIVSVWDNGLGFNSTTTSITVA
jgi:hypothetical protein